MRRTVVIATLVTREGAGEVAEMLRANGIECAVEEPPGLEDFGRMTGAAYVPGQPISGRDFLVFVAKEDEKRAQETLRGAFASEWFLPTSDGHRFHSFEAASVDVLRQFVAQHPDGDDFALREVSYLADLMERESCHTIYDAFHERHLFRRRERLVEGRSLAEWARSCGCYHQPKPLAG